MAISTLGWVAIGTGAAVTVIAVAYVVTRPPEVLPSYAGEGQGAATDAGAEVARSAGNVISRITDAVAQNNAAENDRRARQQEADIARRERQELEDRRSRLDRANPATPTANQR